jgi:hypothetical protein
MEFNIYQDIFKGSEEEAQNYQDQLLALFNASPEAQLLEDEGIYENWTSMLLGYEIDYLGLTPPQMTKASLRELLFDLIVRKVSAPAEDAPKIIRETQLFWTFLKREFHLKNAAACLEVLNEEAVLKLQRRMSDPDNFDMAKSMVMEGMRRGFDMTTEEGLNQWMNTYNAELLSSPARPSFRPKLDPSSFVMIGEEEDPISWGYSNPNSRRSSTAKTKRKMAKNSRKQNRKK